jgi:hypothetical protein
MYRGCLRQKVIRVTPKYDVSQLFTNLEPGTYILKKDMPIRIAADGHISTGKNILKHSKRFFYCRTRVYKKRLARMIRHLPGYAPANDLLQETAPAVYYGQQINFDLIS